MGEEERTPAYSIGVVKRMTGLSERQIRYYDEKGLVVPARTPGQKRMYSASDVKTLIKIKGYLEQGMTIEEVRERLKDSQVRREALLQGTSESDADQKFPERKLLRERSNHRRSVQRSNHLNWSEICPERNNLTSLYPVSDQAEVYRNLVYDRR